MVGELTDYTEATAYEDADPPVEIVEGLPDDLKDAKIKGGETYPPRASIRLNGPPGAGKSTQICLRVATLIENGVDPNDITIVTFRRSLADTIERRLKKWGVIDDDLDLEFWTTTHAACNRVTGLLSQNKEDYRKNSGQSMGPAVTEFEKSYFCAEVLNVKYYAPQPWETTRGELFFDVIEYAHNNLLDPTDDGDLHLIPEYDDLLEEWPGVNVPSLYEDWQEFKDRNDLIEFWELLEAGLTGQLPPTEVVVVDEYHDAYPLMAKVAERWVTNAETAIVAGDPLQVVNAYSGADPRFFTERLDHLPEVLLDKSWRCPETHWQAAARMLEQEFDAPPIARDGRGEIMEYRSPPMEYACAAGWTVPGASQPGSPGALFEEYVEGEPTRDMLLLARTRKQIQGISAALDKAGVVHECQLDDYGWDDHQVKVLNAVLKLSGVPGNYGESNHGSGLLQYNHDPATIRLTPGEVAAVLQHVHAATLTLSSDERDDVVNSLIEDAETGAGEESLSVDDVDEWVKPAFWRKYTDGAATVRRLTKGGEFDDDDLEALQDAAVRYDAVGENAVKKVRVLTIHGSKGSEASDCVVYDGITGTISTEMERSKATRENEARSWYVALTRGSERLHIMREGFSWVKPHLPENIVPHARQNAQRVVEVNGGGE